MSQTADIAPDTAVGSRASRALWWILAAALLGHLLLVNAPGYERDIYWFGTWMRTSVEQGVARVSEKVWCDYPPGYLYLLEGTGLLWKLFTGQATPADDTLGIRFLVKLVPILTDVAGGWVLFVLASSRLSRRRALLVAGGYAANPAMVFTSAVWGQADSVTGVVLALSVWALARRRTAVAFGLLAFAVLVKFQAVVLLPLFLLAVVRTQGAAGLREAYKGTAFVALTLLLPFFWAGRAETVFQTALTAVGRYPYISMNAHNVWWLVGGARSPETSDAMRVGNAFLSYHAIGFLMLGVATCLILWRLWEDLGRERGKPGGDYARPLFHAAAVQVMAFYLLPTQMHERYIVPAVILLAAGCIWSAGITWLYGILSLVVFVSLASTLHAIYPGGLGSLGGLFPAARQDVFVVGVVLVLLFGVLLFWGARRRFLVAGPAVVAGAALLATFATHLPLSSAVSLGDWEPVEKTQGWEEPRRNRSVDNRRLSVAGFIFRHGIGTHADSRLTYHLNGAFREFDAAYGVDDEAARGQLIRFRVLVDGQVVHDSGEVRATGWPRHVRISVQGARYLTLEVLGGADGLDSDHADWLVPMLLR